MTDRIAKAICWLIGHRFWSPRWNGAVVTDACDWCRATRQDKGE